MSRSDTREIVAALRSESAFEGCDDADLEALASKGDRTSVPAGWQLIHEQTQADACYVLLDGTAAVDVAGEQVATLECGAVVGEAGIAGHKLRNASVTAVTPLDLLHIEADAFTSLTDNRPALKEALLARTKPAASATEKA
jgi:CRP/FNR family cyclic AMP-dependent transcriptional regulator